MPTNENPLDPRLEWDGEFKTSEIQDKLMALKELLPRLPEYVYLFAQRLSNQLLRYPTFKPMEFASAYIQVLNELAAGVEEIPGRENRTHLEPIRGTILLALTEKEFDTIYAVFIPICRVVLGAAAGEAVDLELSKIPDEIRFQYRELLKHQEE